MVYFTGDAILTLGILIVVGIIIILILYFAKSLSIIKYLSSEGTTFSIGAFIPILNTYLIGKIGDRENKGLSIFGIVLTLSYVILLFNLKYILDALSNFIKFGKNTWFLFPVIILFVVLNCIAYGRIFVKYNKNGIILAILNFLLGFGIFSPIILFFMRINKFEN